MTNWQAATDKLERYYREAETARALAEAPSPRWRRVGAALLRAWADRLDRTSPKVVRELPF